MTALDARSARRRYLTLLALRWLPTGLLIPIFVLLPLSRGLSLTEIGIVFAVQGFVVFALELPTGGLSDSLGRRPVLILASFVGLVSLALVFLADSVAMFAAAMFLQGIYRALDSGPLEAWYVDATLAAEPDAQIESGLGAGTTVLSLAIASGALLAGGLIALDPFPTVETLALPVLVAIGLHVVGLVAIVTLMREVRTARDARAVASSVAAVPGVIRDGLRLLRSSRVLRDADPGRALLGLLDGHLRGPVPDPPGGSDRRQRPSGGVDGPGDLGGVVRVGSRGGLDHAGEPPRRRRPIRGLPAHLPGAGDRRHGRAGGPHRRRDRLPGLLHRPRRLEPDAHDPAPPAGRWSASDDRPVDEFDDQPAGRCHRRDRARRPGRRDVGDDRDGGRRHPVRGRGTALHPGLARREGARGPSPRNSRRRRRRCQTPPRERQRPVERRAPRDGTGLPRRRHGLPGRARGRAQPDLRDLRDPGRRPRVRERALPRHGVEGGPGRRGRGHDAALEPGAVVHGRARCAHRPGDRPGRPRHRDPGHDGPGRNRTALRRSAGAGRTVSRPVAGSPSGSTAWNGSCRPTASQARSASRARRIATC